MIAKVVPAMRIPAAGPFDYSIPEGTPAPEPGALAIVRFRGKKVPALVLGTADSSSVDPARLRPIERALAGGRAVVSVSTLELLPRLALHYDVPLPLLVLSLLPSFPAKPPETTFAAADAAERPPCHHTVIQLETLFDVEAVMSTLLERRDGSPTLLLSPTLNHSEWLVKALAPSGLRVASYHGSMRPKEAAAAWLSLAAGTADILVSTRGGALAPLPPDGRIAIFAEEEPSFVQFDAEPRYDARFLARVRSRAEGRELLTLAEAPTVAAFADASERRLLERRGEVAIVRLDDERKSGFRGVFADRSLESIRAALSEGRDATVCANRKGTALAVRCADCFAAVSCERCGIAMRAFGRTLRCGRCRAERPIPAACPSCGGHRLRDRGITVDSAVSELASLFPEANVSPFACEADARESAPAILVGTEAMVHSLRPALESRRIGAVVVPHAEQLLGLGDYGDAEEAYALLRGLQAVASRQGAAFVVQTYSADNPAIQTLDWDPAPFYEAMRKEREEFGYPPAWTYLRAAAPPGTPREVAEKALRSALPPSARVDLSGENVYVCRSKPGDAPLPESLGALGPAWSWRADPRSALE